MTAPSYLRGLGFQAPCSVQTPGVHPETPEPLEVARYTLRDIAGAILDMATAVRNCVCRLGVSLTDALRFASTHPAIFIGLGHRLGTLAAGYRADLVAFDPEDISVLTTWVAGIEDR